LFAAAGTPAVDPLLVALKSPKEGTRLAAAEALAGAGALSVKRLSIALANERNARVRTGICHALARMGKKASPAGAALINAVLRDDNEEVRAAAARAIGNTGVGYDDVGDKLIAALASESETLRSGCIDGLAAYGALAAAGLAERLGSTNAREHEGAVEALYRMGDAAVEPLQGLLDTGTPQQRRTAIDIFLRLRWSSERANTLVGLVACLKDKDAAVRRDAAAALGRLARVRPDAATDVPAALLAAAGDPDPAVRAAVLAGLGRLGVAKALAVFTTGQKDKDARVRIAAHYGAWATGGDPAPALEQLRAGLEDPAAREAAAVALGRMASAAEPAVEDLVGLLDDKAPEARRAAARALGTIVRPGRADVRELRGLWKKRAPADVRKAIEAGLRWLEQHQEKTGFWDSDKHGGQRHYDPGVTGLALWAFFGAGTTDSATVRRGLDYLLRTQDIDGVIGSRSSHSFMCYHSIATIALAEAWLLTGNPRCAQAVQHAIDFDEWARNPDLAWRYEPRGGENDTHVTTEVVTALRLGDLAGADVHSATYDGAARWIERMTDPSFGQIGYNFPGGAPARPEGKQDTFPPENSQAMTAAGAWCRQLLGGAAAASKSLPRSIALCTDVPPTWHRPGRDQLYHLFGSLAVHQHGGKAWQTWDKALRGTYVSAQDDDGSWPPTGVWGADGGRVYSTAMALLSLLTPYRYPPEFVTKPKLRAHEKAAIHALRGACKDDDPAVAAAAARALQRIGPRE
ncbi:MAG: HEAT repeat domain-containing protein, partial [Planctomycetota bacterium]|nr:HEAT repeat domain-containing protein [Planctomycetota bacterium]